MTLHVSRPLSSAAKQSGSGSVELLARRAGDLLPHGIVVGGALHLPEDAHQTLLHRTEVAEPRESERESRVFEAPAKEGLRTLSPPIQVDTTALGAVDTTSTVPAGFLSSVRSRVSASARSSGEAWSGPAKALAAAATVNAADVGDVAPPIRDPLASADTAESTVIT